ncbi:MAG: HlyD family efflux transporter periplasmic adaptor subunit [Xanthomonadales bacterium]|nr:HlyD family efflux transporter periplasmic adaptor subunit [Xanthomonadales bacterium]
MARAQLSQVGQQMDYTVVRAPYSGIVTARHVQIGESVRPGQPLISGVSLKDLRVSVQVPQSAIAPIRNFALRRGAAWRRRQPARRRQQSHGVSVCGSGHAHLHRAPGIAR